MNKLIEQARNIAFRSDAERFKHGAVLFNRNKIISKGHNRRGRFPHLFKYGYKKLSIHAEASAILKADRKELRDATLLVVRAEKTKIGNSKPCSACMSLITAVGIRKVFYSDKYGKIHRIDL